MKLGLGVLALAFVSTSALAAVPKPIKIQVTGDPAKALYQALVQADLPTKTLDEGSAQPEYTVSLAATNCSVTEAHVQDDGIERGSCTHIKGTASALAVASALVDAGVCGNNTGSHSNPSATKIRCSAMTHVGDELTYGCELTALTCE
ncbi:MAG TPA: hypothetical protein VL588_03970 [Bdellovibrionota bacterium]|nr:hypothetical protein [Bdellovibrionota bacterium]